MSPMHKEKSLGGSGWTAVASSSTADLGGRRKVEGAVVTKPTWDQSSHLRTLSGSNDRMGSAGRRLPRLSGASPSHDGGSQQQTGVSSLSPFPQRRPPTQTRFSFYTGSVSSEFLTSGEVCEVPALLPISDGDGSGREAREESGREERGLEVDEVSNNQADLENVESSPINSDPHRRSESADGIVSYLEKDRDASSGTMSEEGISTPAEILRSLQESEQEQHTKRKLSTGRSAVGVATAYPPANGRKLGGDGLAAVISTHDDGRHTSESILHDLQDSTYTLARGTIETDGSVVLNPPAEGMGIENGSAPQSPVEESVEAALVRHTDTASGIDANPFEDAVRDALVIIRERASRRGQRERVRKATHFSGDVADGALTEVLASPARDTGRGARSPKHSDAGMEIREEEWRARRARLANYATTLQSAIEGRPDLGLSGKEKLKASGVDLVPASAGDHVLLSPAIDVRKTAADSASQMFRPGQKDGPGIGLAAPVLSTTTTPANLKGTGAPMQSSDLPTTPQPPASPLSDEEGCSAEPLSPLSVESERKKLVRLRAEMELTEAQRLREEYERHVRREEEVERGVERVLLAILNKASRDEASLAAASEAEAAVAKSVDAGHLAVASRTAGGEASVHSAGDDALESAIDSLFGSSGPSLSDLAEGPQLRQFKKQAKRGSEPREISFRQRMPLGMSIKKNIGRTQESVVDELLAEDEVDLSRSKGQHVSRSSPKSMTDDLGFVNGFAEGDGKYDSFHATDEETSCLTKETNWDATDPKTPVDYTHSVTLDDDDDDEDAVSIPSPVRPPSIVPYMMPNGMAGVEAIHEEELDSILGKSEPGPRDVDDGYDAEDASASQGVLGPLSRLMGGTTGVVLHTDSGQQVEAEGETETEIFSYDDAHVEEVDAVENEESADDDHRLEPVRLMAEVTSRQLRDSFDEVADESVGNQNTVEDGTDYEEEGEVDDIYEDNSEEDETSLDNEVAHRLRDVSKEQELKDLTMALCAHLLPDFSEIVEKRRLKLQGFGSWLTGRPTDRDPTLWDENDPDEPGYVVHRLSKSQIRAIEREFEVSMHQYIRQKRLHQEEKDRIRGGSANSLATPSLVCGGPTNLDDVVDDHVRNKEKKSADKKTESSEDIAFERDLEEAELLLEREEKRLKAAKKAEAARLRALEERSIDTDDTESSDTSDEYSSSGSSMSDRSARRKKIWKTQQLLAASSQGKIPPANSGRNPDFPNIVPSGQGKSGELELFHLPIIYKAHQTGFEPTKDLVLEPGTMFAGQYLVQNELGSAAFSTAYRCIDVSSTQVDEDGEEYHDEVCLKVIKNSKDFFDQSLDEIKILELLRRTGQCHKHNIVEVKTFFYHREHLVIVAELLRQNLFEFGKYILDNNEPPYFTRKRLCYITRQCLVALKFIHQLGLVHSDVKPENILLSSYSKAKAKLIDFGSSCFLTDRQSSYIQSRSYRAPEVILGLPYDGKIDVWSLGCVVAEMYTGQVTFQNDSVVTMLSRIEAICGAFPRHMIANGRHSDQFFTAIGLLYEKVDDEDDESGGGEREEDLSSNVESMYNIFQPKCTSMAERLGFDIDLMEKRRRSAEDEEKATFVDFLQKLLTLDPDERPTASEALKHPWILSGVSLTEKDIKYPPD